MAAGEMVPMRMDDGAEIGVYRVRPEGERRGGLVLVQEIFGVTDHIKEQCDLYAAEGYEVLSPALFDREAPGFAVGYDQIKEAVRLARQVHDFEVTMMDVRTCIGALAEAGPVFIVGYCYGGSVAYRAATRCPGLSAASCYYGSMVPLFSVEAPECPTIAHFGKRDAGIPMEGVEQVIARGHPDLEVYLYDAGHGFNSDRRHDYDADSASFARERTLALFRANGG